jgi:hypothetical protein
MEKNTIKTSVILFEKQVIHIPLLEFFIVLKLVRIEGNRQVYLITPVTWIEVVDYYFDEDELEFFEGVKND